jgi:NAD(P)-dependent dehydrogenase (short-subunit alcohol dehydrogenase family)
MGRMDGKVVVITGGGSGIGRASALRLAEEGASVAIGNRNAAAGEETVRLVEEQGGKASFFQTDVTDKQQVNALVKHAIDTHGGLHAAFNNAGAEDVAADLMNQSEEQFDLMINVNVKGVLYGMQAEIAHTLQNGGGSVVNASSIAGLIGFPGHGTYAASRHAVIGLTKSAALEYGAKGVRVNAICPAAIKTEMLDRFAQNNQAAVEKMTAMHPIGRLGEPKEIADAVVWLCSDESSFVLGQSITVDGGFTAI